MRDSACRACAVGRVTTSENMRQCDTCPDGMVVGHRARTCLDTARKTYRRANTQAVNATSCVSCGAGTYAFAGTQCAPCDDGYISSAGQLV